MKSCYRALFHRRQSLSNVLGQITILTKILKNLYPPRPLFNVGTRLLQIMVAVHIQTSTPTLNWGGGRGGQIFKGDYCGQAHVM